MPALPFPLIVAGGSPLERGRSYGEAAADRIGISIEFYSSQVAPEAGVTWEAIKADLLPKVEAWRVIETESFDEMEGIAEGAGVEFGDVLALNCRGAFTAVDKPVEEGCTSFVVMPEASQDGHMLAGQNWDYLTTIEDTIVLVVMKPDRGPAQLLIVEAGQVGRHGYNEHGLALHANGLSAGLQNKSALPSPIWRRRILRAPNVSESLEAALATPRPGTTNLLISHREGFAVDLETTPATAHPLFPENGWFVHTNHFIGPVPEPLRASHNPGGESLVRLGRARHLLSAAAARGAIDTELLKTMLRDHLGQGKSLCAHPVDQAAPAESWGTVASVITDLHTGVLQIAQGPPCKHDYAELELGALFS